MLKAISLDLDGTLFPNNVDDKLWFKLIPLQLSKSKGVSIRHAISYVKREYDKIGFNDVRWYMPEYWLDRFGLDININDLLDKMDYEKYIYQDITSLNAYDLKLVIATNNARSVLNKKLDVIREFIHIDASFSVLDLNLTTKSRRFYEYVCKRLRMKAHEVMHVGDDIIYDLSYARAAGLRSVLIDRSNTLHCYDIIRTLNELENLIK